MPAHGKPQRSDFTASRKHSGYYTRDLGDNGTGDGSKWVEIVRKDGTSLGSVPTTIVDSTIEAFERQNVPDSGYTLDDIFEAPKPLDPPEGVGRRDKPAPPAPDVDPEVVVEEAPARAASKSAAKSR